MARMKSLQPCRTRSRGRIIPADPDERETSTRNLMSVHEGRKMAFLKLMWVGLFYIPFGMYAFRSPVSHM